MWRISFTKNLVCGLFVTIVIFLCRYIVWVSLNV